MLKIDDRHAKKITAFMEIVTHTVLVGEVELDLCGKKVMYKAWAKLKKLFKAEVYKSAKLKPRASDCDFPLDEDADVLMPVVAEPALPSDEELLTRAGEIKPVPWSLPISCEAETYSSCQRWHRLGRRTALT